MSVKVAVRVRPFNQRQKDLKSELVVDMQDPLTILKPFKGEAQRKFTYDFSFWSFDQFTPDQKGYLKPNAGSKYADQKVVQQKIGKNILDNAWQGYHCCLFAYGQTGSGKSYSMIGYGENKGIVPITCAQIFERISKKKQGEEFQVYASMLQIYNEQIHDLTISIDKRQKGGLDVRQNKLLGVYVEGLSKHFVKSYKEIENVMDQGTKNRTIASTQMNATSSRAHTIITVEFHQITKSSVGKSEKISVINLIDLAGSQRQSKTGSTGDRLKEGAGINLSLTTLGQVISILAQNSSGANKFVPYRNSSLTRILSSALGGNSQTIMICALSPASDNYDQNLSTLRYADSAKKIKNKPVINENPQDKIIRELRQENQRLKKLLAQRQTGKVQPNITPNPNDKPAQPKKQGQNKQPEVKPEQIKNSEKKIEQGKPGQVKPAEKKAQQVKTAEKKAEEVKQGQVKPAEVKQGEVKPAEVKQGQVKPAQPKKQDKHENKINDNKKSNTEIQSQMKALQQKLKQMQKSMQQKIDQAITDQKKLASNNGNLLLKGDLLAIQAKGQKLPPYFENISKDIMIHRKLKIMINQDKMTIGKLYANPPNDIIFGGRDMYVHHAEIRLSQGRVFLRPLKADAHLYVNGVKIEKEVELTHLNRVIFGWNSVYLFKNKYDNRVDETVGNKTIDWQFCKEEVSKLVDIDDSDDEEEAGCCEIY